jgi:hypothetical protein
VIHIGVKYISWNYVDQIMLLEALREFVALTGLPGKASNPRLKELMVTLRRAGLTSPQIVALSGGMMSDTIVRQYTSNWRRVYKSLAKELDGLMGPLRELILSGRGVGDVKAVNALDRSVKGRDSSVEEVAELWGYLREDVQPSEVGKMLKFYRNAKDEGLTPASMKVWRDNDEELADQGFNKATRKELLDESFRSGSVDQTILNLREYNKLEDKRAAEREAIAAAEEATRRRKEEEALYNQLKGSRDAFNTLVLSGWTLPALVMAPEALKSVDTPEKQWALIKHLDKFGYVEVGKGVLRLVKMSKAARIDPHVLAQTFQLLRSGGLVVPLDGEQLINLTSELMEKLPGVTIGVYAYYLSNIPDVSDQEKVVAQQLLSLEEDAKKGEFPFDPDDLGERLDMFRLQHHIYMNMVSPKISREIESVKNMTMDDEDTRIAYIAIRDSEILRNLDIIIRNPELSKLSSEEAAGYMARMLTFVKAKVDSDPNASQLIKDAVSEIDKQVSVLNPYWLKTWGEIQERSERRMSKVKH